MDSKRVVRLGVLLVLALGIVATMAGPVVASDHCTDDAEAWPCDEDEDRPPLYDGPEPDIGGNASDAIGSLLDPAGLLPLPE